MMQATTMTKISEKSILTNCLFLLGWCVCLAPRAGSDSADDDGNDGDANAGGCGIEDKRVMEERSCGQKLSHLERSGRTLKIYHSTVGSQTAQTVAEAFVFLFLHADFVISRNGRGKIGLGTGESETLRGT